MDIQKHINTERRDFKKSTLEEFHLIENPFDFFKQWLGEAIEKNVMEANAFCLSTCVNNQPTSRIVYIRDIIENGFVFYTNYESKKGRELEKNSNVSANFFWADLERQIRIEGKIEKVSEEVSDKYFASRPRESQIGAWASMQSKKLSSRKELDETMNELIKKFEGVKIPRPKFWGGYTIKPNYFEFWQGRKNRLHDRFSFDKDKSNNWIISRLYP